MIFFWQTPGIFNQGQYLGLGFNEQWSSFGDGGAPVVDDDIHTFMLLGVGQ